MHDINKLFSSRIMNEKNGKRLNFPATSVLMQYDYQENNKIS